jgi:hypothetical protein
MRQEHVTLMSVEDQDGLGMSDIAREVRETDEPMLMIEEDSGQPIMHDTDAHSE